MTADKEYISCPSWDFGGFAFEKPGIGNITITLFGIAKTFEATSTYVPVEECNIGSSRDGVDASPGVFSGQRR